MMQTIKVERTGDVLAVTLNRPESLNAINIQMISELNATLDAAERDAVRVVTITGEGRAFCAGADLSAFGTEPGASLPFLEQLQALLVRIERFSAPVVAVVNGAAMGGGTELILASDFAIASEKAKVGDGHINVGVIPGGGGSVILPKKLPVAIAKYLVFTGGRMTARELQVYGLFAEVVAPETLNERAAELAETLAQKSPLALRTIKRLMAESLAVEDSAAALALELEANREYSKSYDMAEGISAFNEKRQPVFEGR